MLTERAGSFVSRLFVWVAVEMRRCKHDTGHPELAGDTRSGPPGVTPFGPAKIRPGTDAPRPWV